MCALPDDDLTGRSVVPNPRRATPLTISPV